MKQIYFREHKSSKNHRLGVLLKTRDYRWGLCLELIHKTVYVLKEIEYFKNPKQLFEELNNNPFFTKAGQRQVYLGRIIDSKYKIQKLCLRIDGLLYIVLGQMLIKVAFRDIRKLSIRPK
jgi:hypothetical protein